MTTKYELVVKSYKDDDYRHVVATRPTKSALSRMDDGVNINLNHDEYFTAIEEVTE